MTRLFPALVLVFALAVQAAPQREGLGRTFQKLRRTGKLTVGYFGGSITAGAGASKSNQTSYRALTTTWLKAQFPKAEIAEVNAAVGGTGSDLGAFRCRQDLLSKQPDLIFVEFAVNDDGLSEPRVMRSMEGIVRQIRRANPTADVVFLYTIQQDSMAPLYDKGGRPETVIWHERVAAAYRIPSLNIGKALWQQARDGRATWKALLPDTVHPSDAGYAIYAAEICNYLAAHRNDKARSPRKKLPKPISPAPFENTRMVAASGLPVEGWKRDDRSLARRFPHGISAETAGTELKYSFRGTAIGLYWLIAPDSGDMEWSIDGGAPKRASSWDKYSIRSSRPSYTILSDSLPAGEHQLTVRVLGEKNPESKGTWIRIGWLLVE